jgi:hypothetical protein
MNDKYVDIGLELIRHVKNNNPSLSNTAIYNMIKTEINKVKNSGYDVYGINLESISNESDNKTKLLEIIKQLLDILKPYSLTQFLNDGLFQAKNTYLPLKQSKKIIQVSLFPPLLENDSNLNYVSNIDSNSKDTIREVETNFALNNLVNKKTILEMTDIINEKIHENTILKKNIIPEKTSDKTQIGSGKKRNKKTNKKTNKRTNKKTKLKNKKTHRNKTTK